MAAMIHFSYNVTGMGLRPVPVEGGGEHPILCKRAHFRSPPLAVEADDAAGCSSSLAARCAAIWSHGLSSVRRLLRDRILRSEEGGRVIDMAA